MSSSPTETSWSRSAMPQMGVSVAEGTVVEWRKRRATGSQADETICDVTTDKVDVEIPSPGGGRLARILVEPGTTVAVGEPIAEIDAAATPGEAHLDEHPAQRLRSPVECRDARATRADRSGFISPVVRRIADEHGVDLGRSRARRRRPDPQEGRARVRRGARRRPRCRSRVRRSTRSRRTSRRAGAGAAPQRRASAASR